MTGPCVAVLAVLARAQRVLLVRRANPPDAGLWGFPGGRIEWGEPIGEAALRELFEETAVRARPLRVLGALDMVDRDPLGAVRYHFVLIPVLCQWQSGEAKAGDDAEAARWFSAEDLQGSAFDFSAGVQALGRSALRMRAVGGARADRLDRRPRRG